MLQQLLEAQQDDLLQRQHYERGDGQGPYRNGYKQRTLQCAERCFHVQLPQVRGAEQPFLPELWRQLERRTQVLEELVCQMYVRGMSTRDVEQGLQQACGQFMVSDTQVSRITDALWQQYEAFCQRDLSHIELAFLLVDAIYEPIRRCDGHQAVLVAWGLDVDGRRHLLGVQLGQRESKEQWLELLRDLVRRGLRTPLCMTSDGAPGVIAALEQVWPEAWRQRCWFHKMQNLQVKLPKEVWPSAKARLCDVRDAPDLESGRQRAEALQREWSELYPSAAQCLGEDLEALLTMLRLPSRLRAFMRTTNMVERSFLEQRRRDKVVPHLFEERDVLKLVFGTLMSLEQSWSRRMFKELERLELRRLYEAHRAQLEEDENSGPRPRRKAGDVAA